jgi:hypothetical protein
MERIATARQMEMDRPAYLANGVLQVNEYTKAKFTPDGTSNDGSETRLVTDAPLECSAPAASAGPRSSATLMAGEARHAQL